MGGCGAGQRNERAGWENTKAKKKASTGISLTEFYNKVTRRADMEGLKINVADTKHVILCFFDVLEGYPAGVAFDLVAKGLKRAGGRRRWGAYARNGGRLIRSSLVPYGVIPHYDLRPLTSVLLARPETAHCQNLAR